VPHPTFFRESVHSLSGTANFARARRPPRPGDLLKTKEADREAEQCRNFFFTRGHCEFPSGAFFRGRPRRRGGNGASRSVNKLVCGAEGVTGGAEGAVGGDAGLVAEAAGICSGFFSVEAAALPSTTGFAGVGGADARTFGT
jgi:hypothetical protein